MSPRLPLLPGIEAVRPAAENPIEEEPRRGGRESGHPPRTATTAPGTGRTSPSWASEELARIAALCVEGV